MPTWNGLGRQHDAQRTPLNGPSGRSVDALGRGPLEPLVDHGVEGAIALLNTRNGGLDRFQRSALTPADQRRYCSSVMVIDDIHPGILPQGSEAVHHSTFATRHPPLDSSWHDEAETGA